MTIKKLKPRQFTILQHMADGSGTLYSYSEERIGRRQVPGFDTDGTPVEYENYLYTAPMETAHFLQVREHRRVLHSTVDSLRRLGLIERSTKLTIPLGFPWKLTSAGRRVYEEQVERYKSTEEPTVKVVASEVDGVNSKIETGRMSSRHPNRSALPRSKEGGEDVADSKGLE